MKSRALLILILASVAVFAQSGSTQHRFQAPEAAVDKALRELQISTPGRLPVLDGFVAPDVTMLGKYQRAYYQYTVETHALGNGATSLKVTAKITAWFASEHPEESGYRVLPSNGRLESDLIERLEDTLQQKSSSVAFDSTPRHTDQSASPIGSSSVPKAQMPASSAANPSTFQTALPMDRNALRPPSAQDISQEKRVQQLTEQATNLEEVLHNQSRPNDLVAILKSGTPVFAKPVDGSPALFQADSEDEFKIVDQTPGWVHVQVSGISRGWLRRGDVEMPGDLTSSDSAASVTAPPQPQTHEDTSLFPGDWPVLRGRVVRIIWVHPEGSAAGAGENWRLSRSIFRDAYSRISGSGTKIDGVVIVIDSPEGGMIAATTDALRRWNTGAIPDGAFRKECWADPPETLRETTQPDHTSKSGTE